MKALSKAAVHGPVRSKRPAAISSDTIAPETLVLGGPVGAMQAELEARLSGVEYESWLLPVEPRGAGERVIHILSLGAGVVALTCGGAILWFTMLSPVLG